MTTDEQMPTPGPSDPDRPPFEAFGPPQGTPGFARGAYPQYAPYSQPPVQKGKRRWPFVALGIVSGLMIGSVFTRGVASPAVEVVTVPRTSLPAATSSAAVQPPVTISVSGAKLGDAYDANKVTADKKYVGKVVISDGEVSNIDSGRIAIRLDTTEKFSLTQVSCKLRDRGQAEKVVKGQRVTFSGKVTGQDFGVIGIDDCTVK